MGRRTENERKELLEGALSDDDDLRFSEENMLMVEAAGDKKEVYAIRKSRQHGNQGCDCSLSNAKRIPTKKLKELIIFLPILKKK